MGTRRLDRITATDIEELTHRVAAGALVRRNTRGGRSAREHFIAAARAVYTRAIADDLLPTGASPAHRVAEPRRLPNHRRALTPDELAQINTTARTSGTDPALDALLLRLHTETACRHGGALALRVMDLDTGECLLRLREKGGTLRWVERNFGYGIARACAGHTDTIGAATTTYIKADLQAVATALVAMTGQPHPLAYPAGQFDPAASWTPAVVVTVRQPSGLVIRDW